MVPRGVGHPMFGRSAGRAGTLSASNAGEARGLPMATFWLVVMQLALIQHGGLPVSFLNVASHIVSSALDNVFSSVELLGARLSTQNGQYSQ